MHELLTTEQMYAADRQTIADGVDSYALMRCAGQAAADVICRHYPMQNTIILCGPGNNGGDGYVIAQLLAERGWPIRVLAYGDPKALSGDAAKAYGDWDRAVKPAVPDTLANVALVVDALFGAGLSKPLREDAASLIAAIPETATVISIDMPSGVNGTTGVIDGVAVQADETITFARAKPGHYLLPGRLACGRLHVTDIGITDQTIAEIAPACRVNHPDLWVLLPQPSMASHKYDRGHAVVFSGPPARTGAARLAARGALRVGAGLVTLAGRPNAMQMLAAHETTVMVERFDAVVDILQEPRFNAFVIGPGYGIGEQTCADVCALLNSGRSCVLDADALTSFTAAPDELFGSIIGPVVLTPHEGEFVRLFPDLEGDKVTRARAAAARSGAMVVLKGADTVIAAPDGQAVINANAPAWLGTAGAGDVLAGLIAGLLAQSRLTALSPFELTCAAVWLHGAAANRAGPGMMAEDLPVELPRVLRALL